MWHANMGFVKQWGNGENFSPAGRCVVSTCACPVSCQCSLCCGVHQCDSPWGGRHGVGVGGIRCGVGLLVGTGGLTCVVFCGGMPPDYVWLWGDWGEG